jgi:hypothetical protein
MLQGVAKVRNWVAENIPLTDTLLGYDLFLKLGNDIIAGLPLDVESVAAGLPHSQEEVLAQLQRMAQAGLLVLGEVDGKLAARPTQRFAALLDTYARQFDRLFIVRDDLRKHQLHVAVSDPGLAAFGQLVYDRVFDLGWLYLHNFGSACFLISSLVNRIAVAHGYQSRVASCYVHVGGEQGAYLLGAQGMAKPGQIDGHAVCVVDERMILDFGLGNVRKGYRRDFPWGMAADYRRQDHVMGAAVIPGAETVIWKDDWQSPGSDEELARYAPHLEELFGQYAARFL